MIEAETAYLTVAQGSEYDIDELCNMFFIRHAYIKMVKS